MAVLEIKKINKKIKVTTVHVFEIVCGHMGSLMLMNGVMKLSINDRTTKMHFVES